MGLRPPEALMRRRPAWVPTAVLILSLPLRSLTKPLEIIALSYGVFISQSTFGLLSHRPLLTEFDYSEDGNLVMYSIVPGWCKFFLDASLSSFAYKTSDSGRAQHFHVKVYPEGYIASNGTFVGNSSAVQYAYSVANQSSSF